MFQENRFLSQHFEAGDQPESTTEGVDYNNIFTDLGNTARGLFNRLTGRADREEVRGTMDTFGREFNRTRGSLVDDVRRSLPPATRGSPDAEAAFKASAADGGSVNKMLEDFRRETAALNQQRDKVFAEALGKLEALRQQVEKEEAAEQATVKARTTTPPPAPVATPSAAPSAAAAPAAAPTEFPATPDAIRERFRYTPERFGTPEGYARFLAEQLNSDDRWNKFLQAMYQYQETMPGEPAQILNLGNRPDNDPWVQPLRFMTTYNANGKMFGDCEDLAFFATHIARLQGKPAFSIGIASHTSERRPDSTFRLKSDGGHVFSGWFEPGQNGRRVLRLVSTRTVRDAAGTQIGDSGMFSATSNEGETDAQLLTRLFNQIASVTDASTVPASVRTMDTGSVQSMHVIANGNGYAIHGNAALLARHAEIDGFLQRQPADHANVARVVREELGRDQNNLGLHASLIQFLLLANDRAAVSPAIDALLTSLRVVQPTNRNIVTLASLRDSLASAGFNDTKTQEFSRVVQTWMESNVRPTV